MKLAILKALLLLLALSATEATSDESCRREMSRHSLDKCRSFLRSGSRQQGMLIVLEDGEDNMEAPRMCCEQLGQVRKECRCNLIRKMMQQMAEEEGFPQGGQKDCRGRCGEIMMRAQYLPAMCDMSPRSCRMSSAGGMGMME